ncbi:hypothetical protein KVM45_05840 [Helicobacter pylori]|nr:hypothetical protein KVM45_05840 [Helicobacter pylori]
MSGSKACVVVLCGAMANVAIASPKIEARGELGRFIGVVLGVLLVIKLAEQLGLLEVQWVVP